MKWPWQRKDEDLDAEIQHHFDEAIRDRIARGETPDEARAHALREFGNVGLVKEVTREMWGWLKADSVALIPRLDIHSRSYRGGASSLRRRIPNARCRACETIGRWRRAIRTQTAPKCDCQ